ncbi:calcium-independent phospholipase A2-gamma-like isoform X2 [Epinephelus moara]|uniref:calcium-independent phospholipase A2-gamma-like isoform X2 n=1 Tax=Epinephelus moara TaxID=300413 RepID=UPI00214F3535|nr:calcium-independent phospholipase A2-gamma-like isoform X2 [Epinephelus moara]
MGRYLNTNLCSSSVNKTLRFYCKIRYLMSLLRKYPRLAQSPLGLDFHRYSLLSPPRPSRFTRKAAFKILNHSDTGSTSNHFLRDFTKELKHLHVVRFYSSSNKNTLKPEAPVGIFEEAQNSFLLSSLGGRLGQSFHKMSRHINVYFKTKDAVLLAENTGVVVTTPEYLGRSQRRSLSQRAVRERNVSKGKDTTQTLKSKGKQESSGSSPSTQDNSGPQLFHMSSLATTFGESYNYVANHINSVFSRGSTEAQTQENTETISSTKGTNRKQTRRKMQNTYIIKSKEAEMSQVKSGANQATVEANNVSSSWEEGYLLFARHINKYFGAKVTEQVKQDQNRSLPIEKKSNYKAQSTSPAQGAMSQLKQEEPVSPVSGGLFHSSRNTTNFGENYFQMASHINQYFKGQSELDEDINRSVLTEMDPGSTTSERLKTVSFIDCLRHPTSAIPDLLGAYLKLGPLTQSSKPKPAVTSPEAILNKKLVLSRRQAEEMTRRWIVTLSQASSPEALLACVEALNEHLIRYPSCKAVMWQEKTAVTLLKRRRACRDSQVLQSALRESLALIGYVDPVKGRGIRVLSIDGGGTRGVVPLQVLKLLEAETGKKIHQLFDYICGVSTGAVLAFMLGLAHFSLEECADMYRRFGSEVFRQNPLVGTVKMGWSHSYYDTETWETILLEKLGKRVLIKTAGDELSPKDGGILMNNPCALAVHESRLLWPNQPFQCVLSLGTGRYDNAKKGPATSTSLRAKISNLVSSATDTEGVHTLLDDLLAPDVYFRFNPMLSSLVSLDESRPWALDQLQRDTQNYLERNRLKLARLCLVLGAERSAARRTKDWMSERAWEMKQRWV